MGTQKEQSFGKGGPPADQRFDDGVHVECASGEACSVGDPLVVHDDTVSPWEGNFSFGALFTGNFWEHGIVDLIGGQLIVDAFPQ
jgi:hypothetical protein